MNEDNIRVEEKHLNKLPFVFLCLVFFLVPLFFIPLNFVSLQFGTSLLFATGVLLSIFSYVISSLKSGSIYLPKPSKLVLSAIFLVPIVYLIAGISNGLSRVDFFGYTLDLGTVGFIILSFACLFLVSVYFSNKSRLKFSFFAFVFSAIFLGLFVTIRIIFGPSFLSFSLFNQVSETVLGNLNNISILYGATSIFFLVVFEVLNTGKLVKLFSILFLSLSLFFVILSNFQLVLYLLLTISFIFTLYFLFDSNTLKPDISARKVKKIPILSILVFLCVLFFILYGSNLSIFLQTKLGINNLDVRPSFSVTYDIAKSVLKQNLLFGSGINNFIYDWRVLRPAEVNYTVFWNTDFTSGFGLIPTFTITTGVAGLISWVLYVIYFIYLGLKSIFKKEIDSFTKFSLITNFFISIYFLFILFFYMPSIAIFIQAIFFNGLFFASVYLSGAISLERKIFTETPRSGFIWSIILISIFVGSTAFTAGLYKNSKSLWYFQKSFYALNTLGDADSSERYMLKAISLIPFDLYFRSLSEIEMIKMSKIVTQNQNKIDKKEIKEQFDNLLTNAIKAALSSEEVEPKNYLNWISAGKVYETVSLPDMKVENAFENAELHYKEALSLNPKNPSIYIYLSRLSITHGDIKKARDYALEAVKLKRNYLDAYFVLTQIEVLDNNLPAAIQSVTAASFLDSTNPATLFQLGLLKYNVKDFRGAVVSFQKSINLASDYANAKYFLGLSYDELGQKENATKQFEDILKTNPQNQDIINILANLKSGKPALTNSANPKPEKNKNLPLNEKVE